MTFNALLPRRWRADENIGLTTLQRAMNELFEDFAPATDFPVFAGMPAGAPAWFPKLDVSETEKDLVVNVELPGLELKDVEVNLVGDQLTIKGEKKIQRDEKGKTLHRTERSYGAFWRVLQLPCNIEFKSAKAVFDKGLLTVTLPKSLPVAPAASRIEVKAAC